MTKMTDFNFDTYLPERKIIVRDTAQLPSRERLEKIASWRETYGAGHNVMLPAEEAGALARFALATHEQEPVGIVHGVAQTLDGSSFVAMVECKTRLSDGTELFSHPAPVPAVHLSPDTEYMDEDAECLAMNLDKHNVPKEKGGQELSLWGRVVEFCNQQAPVPAVPMAVAGFNAATAIRACMEEFPESMHDIVEECAQIAENTISTSHAAPVPAVPDGYVMMPMKLTAENGAKYALSGEFHVLHRVTCHERGGEGCSDCDDDGWLEEKIMIGWDDIKDIYRAAVEACSIKSTGEGV